MIRRIRALASLSGPERRTLFRAAWWLLLVDLGLRVVGFARLQIWLVPQGGAESAPRREGGGEITPLSVERIADLVAIVARHHLYPMSCLTKALTSQRMLAAQGIWVDLRIGVCREHDRLRAHAWIEYRGEPVGESADVGAVFGPLGRAGEFALAPDDLVKSY